MIVSGLLAALLTLSLLRGSHESFRVAVSSHDIAAGTRISASSFRFVDVQVDGSTLHAFVQPADVNRVSGWVAGTTIPAGDPVTLSQLRPPSAPSGLEAMSIPVAPELAVGGALVEGDRVDIIAVIGGEASYLVRAAPVLAVRSGTSEGLVGATGRFSVTVGVDPQTALALAAAISQGEGSVQLVRSTGFTPTTVEPVQIPASPGPESPSPSGGAGSGG